MRTALDRIFLPRRREREGTGPTSGRSAARGLPRARHVPWLAHYLSWLALLGTILAAPAVALTADGDSAAAPAQALAEAEARVGASNPTLLPLLDRLAARRFRDGDLAEAAELRRRALRLAIARDGTASPAAAQAMIALAETDLARQNYLDAEPLLIMARNILVEGGAPDDARLVPVLDGLARLARSRGDNAAAERWAQTAAALGGDAPASSSLRALGAALAVEERWGEAERVLRQALERDRAEAGDDGLPTARSLSQLANLYLREKQFAQALRLIEEAAEIDARLLGPRHPFIADDFYDLGLAYAGLKRTGAAERAFLVCLRLLQRGGNLRTPRAAYVQIELARILRSRGDADDAGTAERNARRILRAADQAERRREREI
jgi:tetratricopeptide (TPR) repeat protein